MYCGILTTGGVNYAVPEERSKAAKEPKFVESFVRLTLSRSSVDFRANFDISSDYNFDDDDCNGVETTSYVYDELILSDDEKESDSKHQSLQSTTHCTSTNSYNLPVCSVLSLLT